MHAPKIKIGDMENPVSRKKKETFVIKLFLLKFNIARKGNIFYKLYN